MKFMILIVDRQNVHYYFSGYVANRTKCEFKEKKSDAFLFSDILSATKVLNEIIASHGNGHYSKMKVIAA